jgi:ABC-type cobalamin transport system ATPase subunit
MEELLWGYRATIRAGPLNTHRSALIPARHPSYLFELAHSLLQTSHASTAASCVASVASFLALDATLGRKLPYSSFDFIVSWKSMRAFPQSIVN